MRTLFVVEYEFINAGKKSASIGYMKQKMDKDQTETKHDTILIIHFLQAEGCRNIQSEIQSDNGKVKLSYTF